MPGKALTFCTYKTVSEINMLLFTYIGNLRFLLHQGIKYVGAKGLKEK